MRKTAAVCVLLVSLSVPAVAAQRAKPRDPSPIHRVLKAVLGALSYLITDPKP